MIEQSKEISSLADFKRNTDEFLKRLKVSGQPVVLTVDGKAALVVQDADAYQRLLDLIDQAEALEGIRQGLEDVEAGRTQPVEEALEEIRQQHKIPRDR